jgi:hypothetical protein
VNSNEKRSKASSRKDAESAKESVRMGNKNKKPINFTTKNTKRSKALPIGRLQQSLAQFSVVRFDSSSNYILRGESSLTSGLALQPVSALGELKLEVTVHSKRQNRKIELLNHSLT